MRIYENLVFSDRKVNAKGKGELLTYEVKQMKIVESNSPKISEKLNSKNGPVEDIKQSLERYQRAMLHKPEKKIRLFQEILLETESPTDITISGSSPSS